VLVMSVRAAAFGAVGWSIAFGFWALFLDAMFNGGLL
jgi:hypothetical protein